MGWFVVFAPLFILLLIIIIITVCYYSYSLGFLAYFVPLAAARFVRVVKKRGTN